MKLLYLLTTTISVSLLAHSALRAQEPIPAPLPTIPTSVAPTPLVYGGPPAPAPAAAGNSCCAPWQSGLFFEFEATFFRYYRADGRRVGTGGPADDDVRESDMHFAPRYTLGYYMAPGLGLRARYWHFSDNWTAPQPGGLAVDTRVLDIEVFKQLRFGDGFSLELSGGLRYNQFAEAMNDNGDIRTNNFQGFGIVGGLEARQVLANWATIYGKSRLAILVDDKDRFNTGLSETLYDTPVGMLEIGAGLECGWNYRNGSRFYTRIGGEIQNWFNYSSNFDGITESRWTGASDVGFVGLVFGLGWDF